MELVVQRRTKLITLILKKLKLFSIRNSLNTYLLTWFERLWNNFVDYNSALTAHIPLAECVTSISWRHFLYRKVRGIPVVALPEGLKPEIFRAIFNSFLATFFDNVLRVTPLAPSFFIHGGGEVLEGGGGENLATFSGVETPLRLGLIVLVNVVAREVGWAALRGRRV